MKVNPFGPDDPLKFFDITKNPKFTDVSFLENIVIEKYALDKAVAYSEIVLALNRKYGDGGNLECMWIWVGEKDSAIIDDLELIRNQECTAVETDSDLENIVTHTKKERKGWGHSHGTISAFHSDKDRRNFFVYFKTDAHPIYVCEVADNSTTPMLAEYNEDSNTIDIFSKSGNLLGYIPDDEEETGRKLANLLNDKRFKLFNIKHKTKTAVSIVIGNIDGEKSIYLERLYGLLPENTSFLLSNDLSKAKPFDRDTRIRRDKKLQLIIAENNKKTPNRKKLLNDVLHHVKVHGKYFKDILYEHLLSQFNNIFKDFKKYTKKYDDLTDKIQAIFSKNISENIQVEFARTYFNNLGEFLDNELFKLEYQEIFTGILFRYPEIISQAIDPSVTIVADPQDLQKIVSLEAELANKEHAIEALSAKLLEAREELNRTPIEEPTLPPDSYSPPPKPTIKQPQNPPVVKVPSSSGTVKVPTSYYPPPLSEGTKVKKRKAIKRSLIATKEQACELEEQEGTAFRNLHSRYMLSPELIEDLENYLFAYLSQFPLEITLANYLAIKYGEDKEKLRNIVLTNIDYLDKEFYFLTQGYKIKKANTKLYASLFARNYKIKLTDLHNHLEFSSNLENTLLNEVIDFWKSEPKKFQIFKSNLKHILWKNFTEYDIALNAKKYYFFPDQELIDEYAEFIRNFWYRDEINKTQEKLPLIKLPDFFYEAFEKEIPFQNIDLEKSHKWVREEINELQKEFLENTSIRINHGEYARLHDRVIDYFSQVIKNRAERERILEIFWTNTIPESEPPTATSKLIEAEEPKKQQEKIYDNPADVYYICKYFDIKYRKAIFADEITLKEKHIADFINVTINKAVHQNLIKRRLNSYTIQSWKNTFKSLGKDERKKFEEICEEYWINKADKLEIRTALKEAKDYYSFLNIVFNSSIERRQLEYFKSYEEDVWFNLLRKYRIGTNRREAVQELLKKSLSDYIEGPDNAQFQQDYLSELKGWVK